MNNYERVIFKSILKTGAIDLVRDKLGLFSLAFQRGFKLVGKMKASNVEINEANFEVYCAFEGIDINEYALDLFDPVDDVERVVDVYLANKKRENDVNQIRQLVERVGVGDENAVDELVSRLDRFKGGRKSSLVSFKDVIPKELEFIENVKEGKPIDGALYLYDGLTYKNRQFMKLSYQLKYFAPTDLVVLGGSTSVGKSSFVLALMNVLSGKYKKRAMMFSFEMREEQVIRRMAIAKSGVPSDRIFNTEGSRFSNIDYYNYLEGLEKLQDIPIYFVENAPRNFVEIRQLIVDKQDEIDYVVIDHLHLIMSYFKDEGVVNQTAHITRISREFKALANEIQKPIFILVQLNRATGGAKQGKNRDIKSFEIFLHDIRDSGAIEEDADKIIFLYRNNSDEAQEKEQYGVFETVVKVAKNRAGRLGKVVYDFNGALQRWSEVKDE